MSRADAAPSKLPVLPVTTRPSGSTMAPAGPPVVSSSRQAPRSGPGERFWLMPAWFIKS